MFSGLEEHQLAGAIEAMLFVTDEPISTVTFADMLQVDAASVEDAIRGLQGRLESSRSGLQLQEVAGGWRLLTHPDYHELLEQYVLSWDTRKLTRPMLEVLSIVAYTQPVTRQGIAAVRGVNSDSSVNSLLDKGLIREAGCAQSPGNPVLYATTRTFLEKFGLRSLSDLPDIMQFAPDEETKRFIASRLSSTRIAVVDDMGDGGGGEEGQQVEGHLARVAKDVLLDSLSSSAGVVEKIDFDEFQFEE